jgi:hypothetical protein
MLSLATRALRLIAGQGRVRYASPKANDRPTGRYHLFVHASHNLQIVVCLRICRSLRELRLCICLLPPAHAGGSMLSLATRALMEHTNDTELYPVAHAEVAAEAEHF